MDQQSKSSLQLQAQNSGIIKIKLKLFKKKKNQVEALKFAYTRLELFIKIICPQARTV